MAGKERMKKRVVEKQKRGGKMEQKREADQERQADEGVNECEVQATDCGEEGGRGPS